MVQVLRMPFGQVRFKVPIDLSQGMDFAGIVIIGKKEISVYPPDYPNKAERGSGLNQPAVVTLFDVFPGRKTAAEVKASPVSMDKYAEKVRINTERSGAKLLAYDKLSGTWEFEVEHFSRYGMDDDEDEATSASKPASRRPTVSRQQSIPLLAGVPRKALQKPSAPVTSTPSARFAMDSDDDDVAEIEETEPASQDDATGMEEAEENQAMENDDFINTSTTTDRLADGLGLQQTNLIVSGCL
eukprot:TRINITY_DN9018_c0_g3_i1.p2 TRINITY_DN9018_c0_g3~~TRINITY_DN9018_c0_g3_i1.p2  ORF type:complete len:242 (+),score=78.01 TRINITY_DN9018_c0_g3_i1:2518-3243(+)